MTDRISLSVKALPRDFICLETFPAVKIDSENCKIYCDKRQYHNWIINILFIYSGYALFSV
ncbi:hypothetical protein ATZ36_12155 [Candidatus Endomicrobiellum trichonymphae]|uniref:Uncharacterized protein n=1 Tax=Endomicrobium trichonymphae TaxID=1408204 RepID=A0A1E5IPM2_ENDTX|nr:hypothetical protein ATZ36_12155 [Candidatus Endomicrobium trichonymphae]